MNALTPVAGKIAPLVRLLSSPVDGEVLGAARAIGRVLDAADLDFHFLAEVVERAALPVVVDIDQPEPELPHWQDLARDCLRRGAHRLSDAEMDFARSMATWPSKPTPRQWRWLSVIAMSLGIEVAP